MKDEVHRRVAKLALLMALVSGADAAPGEITIPADPRLRRAAAAPAEIEVNVADRTITMKSGDEEIGRWDLVVGNSGHSTPSGTFQVRRIVWNPGSEDSDSEPAGDDKRDDDSDAADAAEPTGQVKIYFREPTDYIHGESDDESIGRASSHGCIRMHDADAVELAKLAMEHGGETRSPNWFQRVLNRVTQTREVRLSIPVRLRIQ